MGKKEGGFAEFQVPSNKGNKGISGASLIFVLKGRDYIS